MQPVLLTQRRCPTAKLRSQRHVRTAGGSAQGPADNRGPTACSAGSAGWEPGQAG